MEVSSDGEHFFRFPAITNVPYDTQLGGFATMDPTLIHNFAGKYEAFYGTPFDLDELEDNPLLDKNNVTHVRVIDVVGCIQREYATYDSQGHPVNDPWPTPFASSGYDLDAVGVIHDLAHYDAVDNHTILLDIYPNPVENVLYVKTRNLASVSVFSLTGQQILETESDQIDVSQLLPGIYFVRVVADGNTVVNKFVKK